MVRTTDAAIFDGSYYLDQDESGEAIVTVGHPLIPGSEPMVDYRPVLLDQGRRQYLPASAATAPATSEFGHKVAIDRFHFGGDRPPFGAIRGVGLEQRKPGTDGSERTASVTRSRHCHGPAPRDPSDR